MKRTILLLTILTTAAVTGRAAYRGEAAVNYGESDDDSQRYGLGLSWFFDPLTAGGPEPLAEAAFVERPRALSLTVSRTEIDLGALEVTQLPEGGSIAFLDTRPQAAVSPKRVMSRTSYDLAYTHHPASSRHGFNVGVRYGTLSVPIVQVSIEPETPPTITVVQSRFDFHGFEVGYIHYLQPRLAVSLRGGATWEDSGTDFTDIETRNIDVTLNARWLQPLGGDRWLALDGGVAHIDTDSSIHLVNGPDFDSSNDATSYFASANFYLSRSTSVGLSGSYQPDADLNSAALVVRHFFNERLSIGATASRTFPEASSDESTSYSGILSCRF